MSGAGPDTLFVGQRLIRLDQVDSTNSFALSLLKGMSLEEGAVVSAVKQTRGRGQRGNSWEAAPGQNITCSIVLRPVFLEPSRQFDLTRAISLALTDVLSDLIPQQDVRVKWPNDIFCGDKKIAGVLIENLISGHQISHSVVGIGLNVNQKEFHAGGSAAVSLSTITGKEFDLNSILKMICAAVEVRYLQLRSGKAAPLQAQYYSRLFKAGEITQFTDYTSIFRATVVGVTTEGLLLLRDESGNERRFGMKEIAWIG